MNLPDGVQRYWLVGTLILFSLSMFTVAGVIGYKFVKTADYICYYDEVRSVQYINNQFLNGSEVKVNPLARCTKFAGYSYHTEADLAPYIENYSLNVSKV